MSKIEVCLLCGNNEANDTGSHVIPHFLIKSMVSTAPNEKRAANDLSFKLTETETDYHVAREVKIETIESTFNKSVDDIDLENNSDLFTVDNKWCVDCEKKLSTLEGVASEEYKKVVDNGCRTVTMTKNSTSFRLMIYSILWRVSVTNFLPDKISFGFEQTLKELLNDCLDQDRKQLLENCSVQSERINSFPLLLGRTFNEDPSANHVYSYPNKNPQTYILNDLIVNVSEDENFDFKAVVPAISEIDQAALNYQNDNLEILIYSQEEYDEIRNDLIQKYVESRTSKLIYAFESAHMKFKGNEPTKDQKDQFLKAYFELNDQSPDFRNDILIKALMQVLN